MRLQSSLLVFIVLFVVISDVKAREFRIPKLSELHTESDVVFIATLESISPTTKRRGNAVEAIARLKVHMLLKGKCEAEVDLEHLVSSAELPGGENLAWGNELRKIEWKTPLKQERGTLVPEDRKLYFIFAKKTEQGTLSVYRTKSRDCYGVFELNGSDSEMALFMISEEESIRDRKVAAPSNTTKANK